MPFTEKDGIRPDLIINPHALPSRMTFGQIMESLSGKKGCFQGKLQDGTIFDHISMEDLKNEKPYGFLEEYMYNGMTGERMKCKVNIGIVYYHSLRHLVEMKIHSRAKGPVQFLTGQPNEGRRKYGGLRVGQMERECLSAHGCSSVLTERLFLNSDLFYVGFCEHCKSITDPISGPAHGPYLSSTLCRICQREIQYLPCPKSTKLFLQEMGGLNIGVEITKK